MKEHPIVFNASQVRAVLEGRKTQDRRVIKQQPRDCSKDHLRFKGEPMCSWAEKPTEFYLTDGGGWACKYCGAGCEKGPEFSGFRCPFGKVGDRLWVQEKYGCSGLNRIEYAASPADGKDFRSVGGWLRADIMPREASRITLEITNVRIERLRDISDKDCIAEGFSIPDPFTQQLSAAHGTFQMKWDFAHNKASSWDQNPWVWVIDFRRIK